MRKQGATSCAAVMFDWRVATSAVKAAVTSVSCAMRSSACCRSFANKLARDSFLTKVALSFCSSSACGCTACNDRHKQARSRGGHVLLDNAMKRIRKPFDRRFLKEAWPSACNIPLFHGGCITLKTKELPSGHLWHRHMRTLRPVCSVPPRRETEPCASTCVCCETCAWEVGQQKTSETKGNKI